jgi:superfamily II DNA or RNA helicase
MVMDRIVLVEQTSLRLGKYQIDHGVLQAGHWRYKPSERIQICSIQTLARRKKMEAPELLFYDECHVNYQSVIEYIKENPSIKVVGLSATPFTKGLANLYTNVVSAIPTERLIEKGFLCPLKVYIAKEIDMTGAKKVAGEWSAADVSDRGMKITGDIVAEWVKKTHEVFGAPRKTVVFCSGVEHGRDLAKQFAAAGYNFVSISYKEDDEFKRITIEDFSRPDTKIHGLIATDILTKGFDVSDVMIGVSARPFSKSLSSHIQQLGRVLRAHEGKEFALWLDHAGNYLRFREEWDDVFSNGVTELKPSGEATKKEPTEKEKKDSTCPQCKALWIGGESCMSCGYVRFRMSTVESVPGEMKELEAANQKLRIDNQSFYSQLLHYAQVKGYKSGWAFHKYKEKFNAPPNGLSSKPEMPTNATLGWIKSRTIAFAKSRAKAA